MYKYKLGDLVVVKLNENTANSRRLNGKTGTVDKVGPGSGYHVTMGEPDNLGIRQGIWLVEGEISPLPAQLPATKEDEKQDWHLQYTIKLDEREYVRLMQLVVGSGLEQFSDQTFKKFANPETEWL